MDLVITALLVVILSLIFYQDVRDRMVHVWLFIVVFIAELTLLWYNERSLRTFQYFFNVSFVLVLLSVLTIYLILTKRDWKSLFTEYFGLGDLVFLLILAFILPSFFYLVFFIASLVMAIAYSLAYTVIYKVKKTTPLAGLQALCLASLHLAILASKDFSYYIQQFYEY